jgi:hypothetical protein
MKTNPDDNAFSVDAKSSGMTKRELFTSHALAGLLSATDRDDHAGAYTLACRAVTLADSLILALNNLQPPVPE